MTDRRHEVREAHGIYLRRGQMSPSERESAILILDGHGIWSNAQIAAIAGSTPWFIAPITGKTDRTGGRLNPATLSMIREAIALKDKAQTDRELLAQIVDGGTSPYVLADLVGMSVSTVKRQVAAARKEGA